MKTKQTKKDDNFRDKAIVKFNDGNTYLIEFENGKILKGAPVN